MSDVFKKIFTLAVVAVMCLGTMLPLAGGQVLCVAGTGALTLEDSSHVDEPNVAGTCRCCHQSEQVRSGEKEGVIALLPSQSSGHGCFDIQIHNNTPNHICSRISIPTQINLIHFLSPVDYSALLNPELVCKTFYPQPPDIDSPTIQVVQTTQFLI